MAFTAPLISQTLSDGDRQLMLAVHPGGRARFWGALARHDGKIDRLAFGDVVLSTGLNRVQAIGRLGCLLRNTQLADALWVPDPATGSWSNVYTLLDFRRVEDLYYSDLHLLAGYSPKDVFQETRVPSPEQAAAIITGLGLWGSLPEQERQRIGGRSIEASGNGRELINPEASHTDLTEYERSAATITARREEARLVARYRATQPGLMRLRLDVGWTDLYCVEEADLIEAKSAATHPYVRYALGQLLDYAAHTGQPVNRLTALFPDASAATTGRCRGVIAACRPGRWSGGRRR